MDVVSWLRKELEAADGDLLREMVQAMAEVLMSAEVRAHCNAGYGECSPERLNVHNGYRPPCWDRRVGTIDLAIPKLRRGSYYPDWLLDPRRQAERALVGVVAECYLAGVSTRRVDDLVRTLGIQGISKSQVSDLAKELETTVAAFRNRPLSSEDGVGWTAFLRSLVARGLSGLQLAISDTHPGLKDAIAAVLPGASWQRCRTHFARNLLTRVPKAAQDVATLLRSLFAQPARVVDQLTARFPSAAELLAEAGPELRSG